MQNYDVIVVGKGNAALCAALSAQERGVKVLMLEAAPEDESGGNSRFAGGVMRFAFDSVEDLKKVADLSDEEIASSDFGTNTREEFFDDMFRLTQYRTDPDLCETLVNNSLDTMIWLRSKGARFVPNFGRQSGMVNGKRKFFGRLPIEASGGGPGLVENLTKTAVNSGIVIMYETRAVELLYDGEKVFGVRAKRQGVIRGLAGSCSIQHRCQDNLLKLSKKYSSFWQRLATTGSGKPQISAGIFAGIPSSDTIRFVRYHQASIEALMVSLCNKRLNNNVEMPKYRRFGVMVSGCSPTLGFAPSNRRRNRTRSPTGMASTWLSRLREQSRSATTTG